MDPNLRTFLASRIPVPKRRPETSFKCNLKNPLLPQHFAESYSINLTEQLFPAKITNIDYLELRQLQNKDHAYSLTVQGVALARKDQFKDAIKKYDTAIDIDNNCVEAYVARGAAKANQKLMEEAIEDLKLAIKLDPRHKNARQYLDKLLSNQRKRKEDALYYKKCLKNGEFLMPENFTPVKNNRHSTNEIGIRRPINDESTEQRKKAKPLL